MTSGATESIRADRDALVQLCAGFGDAEWKSPSGCEGWSVQDVVAHMGALFWLAVDPSVLPDTAGLATERAQDALVASRRSWSPQQVLDDYAEVSDKALLAAASFETQDFTLELGDLGTYPANLLPNAYAFDHFTHIRLDLFAPRGPLTDGTPPVDAARVAPTLDWIEAAAPQQSEAVIGALPGAVELVVTGPGGRVLTLGGGDVVARVESDAVTLVRWATGRGTWEDLTITASGDADALELVQRVKVF